jgi:hypothetical protein
MKWNLWDFNHNGSILFAEAERTFGSRGVQELKVLDRLKSAVKRGTSRREQIRIGLLSITIKFKSKAFMGFLWQNEEDISQS